MTIKFKGENYFLSGSFYSRFKLDGYKYKNSVSAFLSYKNKERKSEFEFLSPSQARELAKGIEPDDEWEDKKLHYLYKANLAKFEQDKYWQEKLLDIDEDCLPRENLGRILRLVRSAMKRKSNVQRLIDEQEEDIEYEVIMRILNSENE